MDTQKLCKAISKRVIDLKNIHVGDFISYLNFERKEIENRYFVISIQKSKSIGFVIKCYDIITGILVEFYGDELNRILLPENTDKYLYEFNIPYIYTHFIGDHVKFIRPININKNEYKENKDVFIIKRIITTKNGVILVDLVDYNNKLYPLHNIPILFLEKLGEKDNMKNKKNNLKIYNLDDKELLKETNEIIDEEKMINKNDGDEKIKIDELNHNCKCGCNKNKSINEFDPDLSIETLIVSKNCKIISIIDRKNQVEISRFFVDVNDKFMVKQVSEFINSLLFKA